MLSVAGLISEPGGRLPLKGNCALPVGFIGGGLGWRERRGGGESWERVGACLDLHLSFRSLGSRRRQLLWERRRDLRQSMQAAKSVVGGSSDKGRGFVKKEERVRLCFKICVRLELVFDL